jgi:hypothetical protein
MSQIFADFLKALAFKKTTAMDRGVLTSHYIRVNPHHPSRAKSSVVKFHFRCRNSPNSADCTNPLFSVKIPSQSFAF